MRVTPAWGEIPPDSSQRLNIRLNGSYFINGLREALLNIYDLMRGEVIYVPVSLVVSSGPAELSGRVTTDRQADVSRTRISLGRRVTNPDSTGLFLFSNLFPGRYTLRAELSGFQPYVNENILLGADEVREVEIRLEHLPYGLIYGRTLSVYDSTSMSGVEVVAQNLNEELWVADTSDEEGQFQLYVPAGTYRVRAHKTGWRAPVVREVDVNDDEEREINFIMDDRLRVRSVRTEGNFDDRVLLSWLPPGQVGVERVLNYDSEVLSNGVYPRNGDDILAVKFQPPGMCDIVAVDIYIVDPRDFNNARWPDNFYDPFYLAIFLEDPENGLPSEMVWQRAVDIHIARRQARWISVPVTGVRFIQEPFFIGFFRGEQNPDALEALGVDESMDYPQTVFARLDRIWQNLPGLPGDPHIRAQIIAYTEEEQEGERAGQRRSLREVSFQIENTLPNSLIFLFPEGGNRYSQFIGGGLVSEINLLRFPRRDPPLSYSIVVNGELMA
ncbi:MAG: carboxypeptidase-like regulatory domain-containing protein, partial [bacterium]